MKRILLLLSSSLMLVACGPSVKLNHQQLLGKWVISTIYHPMIENDYAKSKKSIDTMKTVELGQLAMWETQDIEVIKAKERKLVEDQYQQMKGNLMKISYSFITDSLLIRDNGIMKDSCHYALYDSDKILVASFRGGNRQDTLVVTDITATTMKIEEPYFKDKVLIDLKKSN